jgi:hypothetical protein
MTRNVRLVFWMAGAFSVGLAIGIGPVRAGYVLAAASLAVIAMLMGTQVVRALDNWRLEHHWKFGRRPTSTAYEERRAA